MRVRNAACRGFRCLLRAEVPTRDRRRARCDALWQWAEGVREVTAAASGPEKSPRVRDWYGPADQYGHRTVVAETGTSQAGRSLEAPSSAGSSWETGAEE